MSASIRYLVVSDLHAFSGPITAKSPSSISASDSSTFPDDIFRKCAEAVKSQFDSIEAVLVAGDLVEKADNLALPFIWDKLQKLGQILEAPVIATAGNHDVDSHGLNSTMPNEALMNLDPPFPSGSTTDRAQYFSEHHAIVRTPNSVVVTLNSSAHHGYVFKGKKETDHGRVMTSVDRWVQRSLEAGLPLPKVRILLTHHHPIQLPDIDTGESSATVGSDGLIRVLSSFGDWLIVHGHKHRAWAHYAMGGGDAPVVISASSFSANLGSGEFARLVRRQFHVVEHHDDYGPKGLIYSWNHDGVDWVRADRTHMFSGISGFGWRTSLDALSDDLREVVASRLSLSSVELDALHPGIRYLTFDDRRRLLDSLLAGTPAIGHLLSDVGEISELHLRSVGGK